MAASDETFLLPPRLAGIPGPEHAPETRRFQGISSLAVSPGGRLWATWYAGKTPGEDENNYVVLASSGDEGLSWEEARVIDPDGEGPVRTFDPELWLDPLGRLRHFWAQGVGHDGTVAGVWACVTDDPDKEDASWSAPRRLTDGVMMCKPLVLSTGEWVLPASTWRKTDHSARAVVSLDKGTSWEVRGGCQVPVDVRSYDEHIIVERRDGSLWMLVRTNYGIGESLSLDGGRSWSPLEPSTLKHADARFFIRRLQSGSLLLVKHGAPQETTGRSHLMACLSQDDGISWQGGLLLDEREGVSYPDGQQAADGRIFLTYDHSRTGEGEILLAVFREENVLSGQAAAPGVVLRRQISRFPA